MIEFELNPYYENVVEEFEILNNCDVYIWFDDFIAYLRDMYGCEYWQREEQYGGPCFVFKQEKDATLFRLKFA